MGYVLILMFPLFNPCLILPNRDCDLRCTAAEAYNKTLPFVAKKSGKQGIIKMFRRNSESHIYDPFEDSPQPRLTGSPLHSVKLRGMRSLMRFKEA